MYCHICEAQHGIKKPMHPGTALIPCWGNARNNHERGATLYAVGSVLGNVLKCSECGHSVSFHGQLMMMLPEHIPGYAYQA